MPAGILAYGAVGLVGTLAPYATLVFLVHAMRIEPVTGSSVGAAIGAFVNYYLNHRFTFQSTVPHGKAFSRFVTVALAGMAVNAGVLAGAVYTLGIHYFVGQLAATGVAFLVTFKLNRRWTFCEFDN